MTGSKIPRSSLVIDLKAGHVQFNRKSRPVFSDLIETFQGRLFPNRWPRGTKTLGMRFNSDPVMSILKTMATLLCFQCIETYISRKFDFAVK